MNAQTLDVSSPYVLLVKIYLNESRAFYWRGNIVRAYNEDRYYMVVNVGTQTYSYKSGEDKSRDGYIPAYYSIEEDGTLYATLDDFYENVIYSDN